MSAAKLRETTSRNTLHGSDVAALESQASLARLPNQEINLTVRSSPRQNVSVSLPKIPNLGRMMEEDLWAGLPSIKRIIASRDVAKLGFVPQKRMASYDRFALLQPGGSKQVMSPTIAE